MRRALGFGLLLFAAPLLAADGRVEDLFAAGNRHYEQGRYEEAAAAYQRILDYGVDHEVVHYNLGNARFKQGRLGEAILQYERALQANPRDREARENLDYASTLTVDRAPEAAVPFPERALGWMVGRTTRQEDAWLLLLGVYLLGGAGVAAILGRRTWRRPLAYLSAILLTMALWSGSVLAVKEVARATPRAVVLVEKVDAVSGPASDNAVLFTVHEGLRVQVRNRRQGWVQILLPSGLNGWVPMEAVGIV